MTYIALIMIIASFFHAPIARAAILSKAPNNLSLAGYWSFDEGVGTQAGDRSGNGNNGTISGATWADGKHGKALSFDGGNDWIDNITQPNVHTSPNIFTISGFIKPGNQYSRFITPQANGIDNWIGYGGSNQNLEVYITETADVNNRSRSSSVGSIPIGVWTHWAVSFNDKNIKIYINGVLDSEYTETIDIGGWTGNWAIGQRGNSTGWYLGYLDDLRVYDRVLSPTDVYNLYRAGQITRKTVSNNGLVGYWPLNEGVGYTAGDSSGNNYNGSFSGSVSWVDGKRGKAVDFAGGSINSNYSTPFNFVNNNFSVGAWFKLDSTSSYRTVVSKGGFWANDEFVLYALNGAMNFYVDKGGVKYNAPTTAVATGQWYHAVGTYDGSYINLYVNGVYIGHTAVSNLNISNATNLRIGSGGGGGDPFDGIIDDVRVYSRALSAAEVQNLYKQTETAVNHSQNTRSTTGLVGLWSFNGPDYNSASTTAEVLERSGRSFNGDASNSPVTTIGKVGQALRFDGVDDHVLIQADDTNFVTGATGTLSFSFWMKPTVLGGTILSRRHPCNNDGSFRIYINGSTINLSFYSNLDTGTFVYSSGNILTTGEWQHIGITKQWGTASSTKLYLNGVAQTFTPSGNDAAQGTTYTTLQEIIGAEASTSNCNGDAGPKSNFFNGSIDEVRIYNRVLTADEVKQLYNMGK